MGSCCRPQLAGAQVAEPPQCPNRGRRAGLQASPNAPQLSSLAAALLQQHKRQRPRISTGLRHALQLPSVDHQQKCLRMLLYCSSTVDRHRLVVQQVQIPSMHSLDLLLQVWLHARCEVNHPQCRPSARCQRCRQQQQRGLIADLHQKLRQGMIRAVRFLLLTHHTTRLLISWIEMGME